MEGGTDPNPPGKADLGEGTEEEKVAKQLFRLAVNSDSNSTIVNSNSATSIHTEDFNNWSSSLGKTLHLGTTYSNLKSIVSDWPDLPDQSTKGIQNSLDKLFKVDFKPTKTLKLSNSIVTPIVSTKSKGISLNYAETVKRTVLKAKLASKQVHAKSSARFMNLHSTVEKIGASSHQLSPIFLTKSTKQPTLDCIKETLHNDVFNVATCTTLPIVKPNNDTKHVKPLIVSDVPLPSFAFALPQRNPTDAPSSKRIRVSSVDEADAGPSNRPDSTARAAIVPSWADFNAAMTDGRGAAPRIPENSMAIYRTLRNAETKKAKAVVVSEFMNRYKTGRITPHTYQIDVTPPFG